MAKKVFLVLGILLAAALAVLVIFLLTFDADRYRPQVIQQMETALGKPVRLERLSIGWRGGFGLQLQGLAILSDPAKQDLLLKVDSANLVVPLKPLVRSLLSGRSMGPMAPPPDLFAVGKPAPAGPIPPPRGGGMRSGGGVAQARLVARGLELPPMKSPVQELTVNAHLQGDRLDLERLGARVADGTVAASVVMENLKAIPRTTLQLEIRHLSLKALLPETGPGQPTLEGRFSLSFQGKAEGLIWEKLSRSLTGSGRIQLEEGVVKNLNILREVFQRLSVVPGLALVLQARLPESYQEKWNARDTMLEPIDFPATAGSGAFSFEQLRVATDTFELVGRGRVGLEGTLGLNTLLRIEPALSEALIRSVNELQVLTDSQGRLEIPVMIQGPLNRLAVQPDLQYVLSRVAVTKVQDLLGGLLEKALEGKGE